MLAHVAVQLAVQSGSSESGGNVYAASTGALDQDRPGLAS